MVTRFSFPSFIILVLIYSWFPWYLGGPGLFPLGVSVAGLVTIGLTEGKQGYREAFHRLIRWRVGRRWYGVVLFWMMAVSVTALGVH
jgi:hypothetical protein